MGRGGIESLKYTLYKKTSAFRFVSIGIFLFKKYFLTSLQSCCTAHIVAAPAISLPSVPVVGTPAPVAPVDGVSPFQRSCTGAGPVPDAVLALITRKFTVMHLHSICHRRIR